MDLNLTVLRQAIREDLRGWWLRYAWLWLLPLALALIYRYLYAFELENTTTVAGGGIPSAAEAATLAGGLIKQVGWPGVMLIWLAAVGRINKTINAVADPDSLVLHRFRFVEGMRQGVFPVAVFTVFSFAHVIINTLGVVERQGIVVEKPWLHYFLIPMHDPLALVVAMTWVIALAAVTSRRPWVAWGWVGILFCLPPVVKTAAAVVAGGTKMTLIYNMTSVAHNNGPYEPLFLFGLVAGVLMIISFRYRAAAGYWPACIFLTIGALYESGVALWGQYRPGTFEVRKNLGMLLDINGPFHFVPVWLRTEKDTGLVQLTIKAFSVIPLPTMPGLQYATLALFLLLNIAAMAALYLFICQVLLKPPVEEPAPRTA